MPIDPFGQDFYLDWNGDFILTATGSIQAAVGWDRIRQRIIRRLITNSFQQLPSGRWTTSDYVFEPDFGLGMGAMVDNPFGEQLLAQLEARINRAVLEDDNIDSSVPPSVKFFKNPPNQLFIAITVTLIGGVQGQIVLKKQ